jgi:hypothetical protein
MLTHQQLLCVLLPAALPLASINCDPSVSNMPRDTKTLIVIASDTGFGVPKARVTVSSHNDKVEGDWTTDDNGQATIEVPHSIKGGLQISAAGYQTYSAEGERDTTKDPSSVTISLDRSRPALVFRTYTVANGVSYPVAASVQMSIGNQVITGSTAVPQGSNLTYAVLTIPDLDPSTSCSWVVSADGFEPAGAIESTPSDNTVKYVDVALALSSTSGGFSTSGSSGPPTRLLPP